LEFDRLSQSKELDDGYLESIGYGTDKAIRFRCFHVLPGERRLLRNGLPVDVGSRAFDLLMVLLRSRGIVVTKNEIVSHVWPSTVVEESNLRFQMASLRKALGEDRDVIKTIPGRGYLLTREDTFGRDASNSLKDRGTASTAMTPPKSVPTPTFPAAQKLVDRPVIVVIDDDHDTREALDGLLRSFNLRVASFPTVRAFLDSPRPWPLGCLVLDVWLPDCSGLEFQADLVKKGLQVPIIFISGHADVPMSVRAMKAGAVEFFTKPVRHQELLQAIQSAIASAPWE
jgi:DNA-binding response OmpR family regulator